MHPILFHLGSFPVHSYGALGAVAFLVGAGLVLWRSHRLGLDPNRMSDVIFWTAIVGLLGARGLFVLQNPGTVSSLGDVLDLRGGGLVFYGALVTGLPVGFALMKRFGLPVFATWDIWGTAFPLSHAISRVGCYAAGCCYGAPSDAPWAVRYPVDSWVAPPDVPLHPVQLYEAAALLLVAVATNLFYPRRRYDGQVFLLYLVMYAVVRAVTEAFRGDLDRGWFLESVIGRSLSFSQGMSLVFALVGLVVFFGVARRTRQVVHT